MNDTTPYAIDPEECLDLTLQLILETGHYGLQYDARVIRVYSRLPFQQRSIITNRLLLELPPIKFNQVVTRYEEIERLTRAAVAMGEMR